jgi:indolepyruvate ferredoxin oxidoreductase
MFGSFKLLARLKGLRGTAFDPFGYTAERKSERETIASYRQLIEGLLPVLTPDNHALIARIAGLADTIRGYGYIKDENKRKYDQELAKLLASVDTVKIAKAA